MGTNDKALEFEMMLENLADEEGESWRENWIEAMDHAREEEDSIAWDEYYSAKFVDYDF